MSRWHSKRPRHPLGNYHPALEILGAQIRAGDVVNVTVRHEDHCALLAGRGACDCEPEIEAESAIRREGQR
jgi:hypothetical protein